MRRIARCNDEERRGQVESRAIRSQYRSTSRPCAGAGEIAQVVKMIDKAQRPLIVAGQGVFQRKGWDALVKVADKIGVCENMIKLAQRYEKQLSAKVPNRGKRKKG